MTREEWYACADPTAMLRFLGGRADDRRTRLFGCALVRRALPRLGDARLENLAALAEEYADDPAREEKLGELVSALTAGSLAPAPPVAQAVAALTFNHRDEPPWYGYHWGVSQVTDLAHTVLGLAPNEAEERRHQSAILHCLFVWPHDRLFGCPPPMPDAVLGWGRGTVRRIAEEIYQERAFDRLPVLGDALEDAGCPNAQAVRHCHGKGPHARGCWVVDLILGKE